LPRIAPENAKSDSDEVPENREAGKTLTEDNIGSANQTNRIDHPDDGSARGNSEHTDSVVPRDCPSCGGPSIHNPIEVRSKAAIEISSNDAIDEYWGGFRRDDFFFDYVRCESCGLLYNAEYLRDDLIAHAYSDMEDNTSGVPQHLLRKTQGRYVAAMENFAPMEGVYLEIGPDIGLAAGLAVERGSISKLVLVEPNRATHNTLHLLAPSVDTVVLESIDEMNPEIQVDRLFLVHVLDHLTNPRDDLIDLRERMAAGGLMAVVVHNEASFLRRVLGRKWPPFRLQHPQLFSRRTLTTLIESCDFNVLKVRSTFNTFSVRHLLATGLSMLGLEPRWLSRVPELALTVPLGNIVAVAEAV